MAPLLIGLPAWQPGKAFLNQVPLKGTDVLGFEQVDRLAEMLRESGYLLDIRCLGFECEITHLHVFDHALTKRVHGILLVGWSGADNTKTMMSYRESPCPPCWLPRDAV